MNENVIYLHRKFSKDTFLIFDQDYKNYNEIDAYINLNY